MNEKINIAEILKDCPKGMKLYSPLCGEVTFLSLDDSTYPITVVENKDGGREIYFTSDGRYKEYLQMVNVFYFHPKIKGIGLNSRSKKKSLTHTL